MRRQHRARVRGHCDDAESHRSHRRTGPSSHPATRATKPKPLDRIRPSVWLDDWNDELLDLLRVLTFTTRQYPEQDALLTEICDGELILKAELPDPDASERKVPPTLRKATTAETLAVDVE